jgi:taurine dioxygenase
MATRTPEFRPCAGALGAQAEGIDLSQPLDGSVLSTIRSAFAEHLVLFFRDQRLTPESLTALTASLGEVSRVPYVDPLPGHPEVIAVLKEADERNISVFGGDWHSDFSFLDEPPLGSVLYADEVPPTGGDTLWANMYAAYEALSPGMRAMLGGLRAMHSGRPYGLHAAIPEGQGVSRSIGIHRNQPEADAETVHPVVRRHAETGRPALFVNAIYTTRFENMSEEESRPLLDFLYAHATRPEFTCRFRWRAGSVALWDNRCTLHYAINDYDGHRRLMYRTTIAGERPIMMGR